MRPYGSDSAAGTSARTQLRTKAGETRARVGPYVIVDEFFNGWAAAGDPWDTPAYRKGPSGIEFKGEMSGGTFGTVAFVVDADHLHIGNITKLKPVPIGIITDAAAAIAVAVIDPDTGEVTIYDITVTAGSIGTGEIADGSVTIAKLSFDPATQAELDAHITDATAAHAASAISADSATLVGTGTDVQAVLEELDNGIADHLADSSGAHAASAISFSPTGTIAATDVQSAIAEVASEAGGGGISPTLFDANTILKADSDDTPVALTLGASTILARLASGGIVAATPAELRTLLALVVGTNVQAFDATLAALAAADWVANALPIGSGADALSQVAFAANRFPARASTGDLVAKTISDFILGLVDDADAATARATLGIGSAVGGSEWTVVTKAADESNASNTTVQNDDELFFTATAGKHYEFECVCIYSNVAGGTPDLKVDFGEDATARGQWTIISGFSASDGSVSAFNQTNQTTAQVFGTSGVERTFKVIGTHSGNGGTFRLRWSQAVSNVSPTVVKANSVLRYRALN